MWRSSFSSAGFARVRRRTGSRERARGFTLLEAMVSLLLLVIILIVAMTMLFQMRAFAERQQYFMLPRQAARRATDYLSYYIAGASDVNYAVSTRLSPNAIIMYYDDGVAGLTQASFNNLGCPDAFGVPTCTETGNALLPASGLRPANTSTAFGDIGTDTITMIAPFNPSRYQVSPSMPPASATADVYVNFRVGCGVTNDDVANMAAFQAATGFDGVQSALLMLIDNAGAWGYVRIPALNYKTLGRCSDVTNFQNIQIEVDTTGTTLAAPHGTGALNDPVFLVAGLQVISFRVLTDSVDGVPKLQQKLGLFDPVNDTADNVNSGFTNVMENVEDLQFAYMYSQNAAAGAPGPPTGSLVWNTASQTINAAAPGCAALAAPGCLPHVPFQAGPTVAAPALDIQNVIGIRFSVTGRSPLLPIGARQLTNVDARDNLAANPALTPNQHFRPASEDHLVSMDPGFPARPQYDQFDHYRATATLLLRNRIPRG